MNRTLALTAVAVLLAGAAACSSSSDSGPGAATGDAGAAGDAAPGADTGSDAGADAAPDAPSSPPATAKDCDDAAAQLCARGFSCTTLYAHVFDDEATCAARLAGQCKEIAKAPGSGLTQAALATCTAGVKTATCDTFAGDSFQQPGCDFAGALALGAQCAFDEQCASGRCSGTASTCGSCEAVPKAGEDCTGPCDKGLYCTSAGKCAPKVAVGQACTAAGGCLGDATCVKGMCAANGKLDDACDMAALSAPPCSYAAGFTCDGATKTCKPFTYAAAGEACGFVANTIVLCDLGLRCETDAMGQGTCLATVAEGGACTASSECAVGLSCVAGKCGYRTAGVCK